MLKLSSLKEIFPGLALSGLVTLVAIGTERAETAILGFAWVDSLIAAIMIGTFIHTVLGMKTVLLPGIRFSSKILLEIAIVLLGASISASTIGRSGALMLAVVAVVVFTAIALSYGIGRMMGLSEKLATLVACGNSICGNSAIVATAPVIEADSDDVAASIAFTAALGILVVLLLPLGFRLFGLTETHYGMIAGMTVYAVPQVLAATVPVGIVSTQIGTLVKLMRVLMLGPVILVIGLIHGREAGAHAKFSQMVPWFIIGFIAMAMARSFGLVPDGALEPMKAVSTVLTVLSMAALGLSVDLRTVLASGGRVLATGFLSILLMLTLSIAAIGFMPQGL